MRRIRSVALVCAGPVSRGSVSKLPGLVEHLGWVKAPTFRLASRAVNALRSGSPVETYEDLDPAPLIVVSVPASVLTRTIRELASSRIDWRNRAAVVLDTDRDSTALDPLRQLGALPATLHPIGGLDRTLVMEGEPEAVRLIQKALGPRAARALLRVTTDGKARLLEGIEQSTRGFLPLVASVTDHFKSAGLSKTQADALAHTLLSNSMRAYFRGGRRVLTK